MEAQARAKAKRSNTQAKNWNWASSDAETKSQTTLGKYCQNTIISYFKRIQKNWSAAHKHAPLNPSPSLDVLYSPHQLYSCQAIALSELQKKNLTILFVFSGQQVSYNDYQLSWAKFCKVQFQK